MENNSGINELEEALEIALKFRFGWKKAALELKRAEEEAAEAVAAQAIETPLSYSNKKRAVSSPAKKVICRGEEEEKRRNHENGTGKAQKSRREKTEKEVWSEVSWQSEKHEQAQSCLNCKNVLGNKATMVPLEPRATLEIKDPDGLTEKVEVEAALHKALPALGDNFWAGLTRKNTRGLRIAIVEMNEPLVLRLIDVGRLRIGWVSCRIKRRNSVERCFRCLGFDHSATSCRGSDNTDKCFHCGQTGHKKQDCRNQESYVIFTARGVGENDLKHALGSGGCRSFREALKKVNVLAK
ncbi:Uncharacterized 50 kDa protein in type I retrotransposable element R1DM [Anthophora quadrimaculata]